MTRALVVGLLLVAARGASAQSADPTAEQSRGAPRPGDESGRTDDADSGDGVARVAGRAVLFFPRLAFDVAWLPVHGALLATDRYHVDSIYYDLFYNDARTFGVTPVVAFQSGLGLDVGARLVASDLFGEREHLSAQATTGRWVGTRYRERFKLDLGTGRRLGSHLALGLEGRFDRHPSEPFYGIGNGDGTDDVPAMPIDAQTDPTSIEVKYRLQAARVAARIDVKPIDPIRVRLTGALTELEYGPSTDGVPIDAAYMPSSLPGYTTGVRHAYGELAVRWDGRERGSPWEPKHEYSQGSLVDVFGGRVHRLDGGHDFWRFGIEAQHFFRLARGPRTLITRFHASGVDARREEVPFSELPTLGGGDFLRGYSYERFRDRAAAFVSLQYQWDLSHFTDAYVFTDAGRVYESFEDVTLRGLRVGYGVGIDVHSNSEFLFTLSVASSIEGGIFLNFGFNQPINGVQPWR